MNRSDAYRQYFNAGYMMGPCTLRLLEELMERHAPKQGGRALDLGCGTGLSSLFTARETGSRVMAVDLWISAADNWQRVREWGMEDAICPLHIDAHELPFAPEYFDTVVSVDAYHYFAGDSEYFAGKLLPLLKPGGLALIAVPGLKREFDGDVPKEMLDWAGEDHTMFRSCDWWRRTIGSHPDMEWVDVWEMDCFDRAWQEWFDTGHKYARQDKACFDSCIARYTNFVGMAVRRKA